MQLHEPWRLLVEVSESYIATTVGLLECRCTAEEWAIWVQKRVHNPSVCRATLLVRTHVRGSKA